jgi:hypothetical protein
MEKDRVQGEQTETEPPSGEQPPAGAVRPKPYKPPTIGRHGNLRLMTQLE